MSQPVPEPSHGWPRWLTLLASLLIAGHLLAVAASALAATSGPWPMPDGINPATPPPFAQAVHQFTTPHYLRRLNLAHNFHFASNRAPVPGVACEVRLKDDQGQTISTVRIPDPRANPWVRHRQELLVQQLAPDDPVQPPPGEVLSAPGHKPVTTTIWEMAPGRGLVLKTVPEHLVPRDRPVFGPSEWSLVLTRSYARYLCRTHGAASAEFVRQTREPVHPALLFMPEPPPGALDTLVAHYGDLPR
jgi:hypothetical protein